MKNRTIVKIKGLNQERAINNLSKSVNIYNFKREESNLSEFEVEYKDRKKIEKLVNEEGLEIISISHYGIKDKLKKLARSYGIVLGLVLSIVVYLIQYLFVWKIEVRGSENYREIQTFIEENLSSRLKYQIDTKNLEVEIKNNFDKVSSISIAIVGQSLIVNINPSLLPDEMKGEFDPIVASENGLIKDINLIQGTLNCKIGDIVQKGDVLVYPYIIDSQGEKRNVKPKADIFAEVWLNQSYKHYDYLIKKERTGRKVITSQVLLNNLVIYDQKNEVDFKEYEVEMSYQYLTKNLILPFRIKKEIYYEVEIIEVVEDFNTVKDKIIEDTRQKALIFLKENEIIINETYTIKEEGNCNIVNYIITVERNIGG